MTDPFLIAMQAILIAMLVGMVVYLLTLKLRKDKEK